MYVQLLQHWYMLLHSETEILRVTFTFCCGVLDSVSCETESDFNMYSFHIQQLEIKEVNYFKYCTTV